MKEGSDKERGRWEGVCVRDGKLKKERKREGGWMDGWMELFGDIPFSWMLPFLFMALSLLCAVSVGADTGTQPQSRG